ncbi:MAG: type IX secretion system sortase PorU [Bacteroidetes bacterium]|nr:type IX secretion system sortase PorU [Bacteroidota bacterium]
MQIIERNLQTRDRLSTPKRMKMTRYYAYSLLLSLIISFESKAQSGYLDQDFTWQEKFITQFDSSQVLVPFANESEQARPNESPVFTFKVPLNPGQSIRIIGNPFYMMEQLDEERYFDYSSSLKLSSLRNNTDPDFIQIRQETERKQRYAVIEIPVIEKEGNGFNRLTHVTLKYDIIEQSLTTDQSKKGINWKSESLLKDGNWAKVIFAEDGIYQLNVGDVDKLGIGANGQDISKIHMYAYAGGMLPEANSLNVYDDLEEMAILVRDRNGNGKFDGEDDILFYVNGPNALIYNPTNKTFTRQIHYYSTLSAAFITVGDPGGKRIEPGGNNPGSPTYTTSTFDEIIHLEDEKYNLIRSGRDWFGQEFGRAVSDITLHFNLQDIDETKPAVLQTRAAARSESTSILSASIGGQTIQNHPLASANVYFYAAPYTSTPDIVSSDFSASGPVDITFSYFSSSQDAKAWLDYAEVVYRRKLQTTGQLLFRDSKGLGVNGVTRYNLTGTGYEVWDVTDPLNIFKVTLQNDNGNDYFVAGSSALRQYAAFKNDQFKKIISTEIPVNQNIHGNKNVDYVIVTHPDFLSEANRLADFHRNKNGMNVLVVQPFEVYNEFSSGVPDISAFRNMMRYFYETAAPGSEPKYMLFFGDASYDYKNITKDNKMFLPTYESANSYSPVGSYCTDDYFGLLDENEGGNIDYVGYLDLGIGRLPVQTLESARQMVDKVLRYYDASGLGDWRNTIVVMSDDEDSNIHMHDAMSYGKIMETDHPVYNVRKVFADAYKQETVGNGQRYPDVVKEVNRAFNDGALIVNYSGHGGETQLGAEKYVDIPQINSWDGGSKLPLFITATCEFSRFDDPARQSAGEMVILNPKGGAVGMLTTVRLVYQSPNRALNENFYRNNAFDFSWAKVPALGDVVVKTKNGNLPSVNNRSFVYLGDPAVQLAYPKYNVVASTINSVPVDQLTDTALALSKFTLEGEVQDLQNVLMDSFNGTAYTTIFAPQQEVTTLANDPASIKETFKAYTSIIYKGKSEVVDGKFKVSFILPRDLPFNIGDAKISFYAENGIEDGHGYQLFQLSPKVDPNAVPDYTGPQVRLFMNDSFFVRGGVTDENPYIYALIYDTSGINTTGLGIGRDISSVLDNNNKEIYILNQYYDANLNDFRRGTVKYPLSGLSEGKHTLSIKVWDVYNNSATATTDFIVTPNIDFVIQDLMSYPNPFSQSTTISFEHNQQGKILDMRVLIYDSRGILVKTLTATELATSSRMHSLVWNPYRDGYSEISPGLYYFKLVVKNEIGKEVEASSRLVYMPNP